MKRDKKNHLMSIPIARNLRMAPPPIDASIKKAMRENPSNANWILDFSA